MSVISGVSGAVEQDATPIGAVGNWSISHSADLQSFVSSATDGAEVTIAGNTDWTGSYEAFGDTPAVLPGEGFVFHGSFDGVNGANGTVVVDEVVITCPVEDGGPIKHTVTFSANGDLTLGAETAADNTVVAPLSAIARKVQVSDVLATPSFTEILDIRSWTLTIRSNNPSYVSSTTAGVTKRVVGGLSAEISISVYTDDASGLPQPNDVQIVRLFTTVALFWELDSVIFGELSDIGANIEDQSPVEATLAATFTGYATDEVPTYRKGSIKTPAVATVWP